MRNYLNLVGKEEAVIWSHGPLSFREMMQEHAGVPPLLRACWAGGGLWLPGAGLLGRASHPPPRAFPLLLCA